MLGFCRLYRRRSRGWSRISRRLRDRARGVYRIAGNYFQCFLFLSLSLFLFDLSHPLAFYRSGLLQDIPTRYARTGAHQRLSFLDSLFSLIRSFHSLFPFFCPRPCPSATSYKASLRRLSFDQRGGGAHIYHAFAFANFTEVFYKPSLTNGAAGR